MKAKNNSLVKVSQLTKANSPSTYAVRIVGATMNSNTKDLLKIFKLVKDTDDAISFCALSGIFYVMVQSDQNYKKEEELDTDWDFEKEFEEEFPSLVESFEKILLKDMYSTYPIAVMPELKLTKEDFWLSVWGGIFSIVLRKAFSDTAWKMNVYGRAELVNKVLFIAAQYNLFDQQSFFKLVKQAACDKLDTTYVSTLSNSVNKIWDAGRAGREYFMRKFILFNPAIPNTIKKEFNKRWQAWFLLEDSYKQQQKTVKRSLLLKELKESIKLL